MVNESAALLYQRRAPRIIAQEDLELRLRGFDEPSCVAKAPAPDVLRGWTRVLELSWVFAAAEEAMARIGVRVGADVIRETARIDTFVRTVTRLDIGSVFQENREALTKVFSKLEPPSLDAVVDPNLGRVVDAAKSLLTNCPISALERTGALHGLQEMSHRSRLAFDGLTALVARNSQPIQSAVAAAGHAYAEGRLSIDEVAAVLGTTVPDAVAVLEEQGFVRSIDSLRLPEEKRSQRLRLIREDRLARGGVITPQADRVGREVIASQRIENIDARPWLP